MKQEIITLIATELTRAAFGASNSFDDETIQIGSPFKYEYKQQLIKAEKIYKKIVKMLVPDDIKSISECKRIMWKELDRNYSEKESLRTLVTLTANALYWERSKEKPNETK